jgi:hypothetical protein
MKNEADVKDEVKKVLKTLGAWWFMPVQTGYGVQGIPDFIVCLNGKFIAIETKFGNNKLTTHQERQLKNIEAAKGGAFVINEKNVRNLPAMIAVRNLLEDNQKPWMALATNAPTDPEMTYDDHASDRL